MKYFFLLQLLLFSLTITAQKNDSLPKHYQQLQLLIAPFFIPANSKIISQKENINTATLEIVNMITSKSNDALTDEGLTFGNMLPLPTMLQVIKDSLLSSGNGELLNNFNLCLQKASASAFEVCLPNFTQKKITYNVQELLTNANKNNLCLADLFSSAYKNTLLQIATPLVNSALKNTNASECFKKLVVAYKNITGSKLKFNYQDLISETIVNRFLAELKTQEVLLKQNPSSLLNKLKGL